MKFWYLIVGVIFVAIAFDRSRKFGVAFLVIIVLGMLISASDKGVFK